MILGLLLLLKTTTTICQCRNQRGWRVFPFKYNLWFCFDEKQIEYQRTTLYYVHECWIKMYKYTYVRTYLLSHPPSTMWLLLLKVYPFRV